MLRRSVVAGGTQADFDIMNAWSLTNEFIGKATCLSVGVGSRDAAVKPTGTYSRRPTDEYVTLPTFSLVWGALPTTLVMED
jgi:hypothetical protein